MRQGLMKTRARRPAPKELPIVACDACLDWHRKGKHTADPATRKINLARARERAGK
jgi:hypothetical protein